jgi:hypothetical protein
MEMDFLVGMFAITHADFTSTRTSDYRLGGLLPHTHPPQPAPLPTKAITYLVGAPVTNPVFCYSNHDCD